MSSNLIYLLYFFGLGQFLFYINQFFLIIKFKIYGLNIRKLNFDSVVNKKQNFTGLKNQIKLNYGVVIFLFIKIFVFFKILLFSEIVLIDFILCNLFVFPFLCTRSQLVLNSLFFNNKLLSLFVLWQIYFIIFSLSFTNFLNCITEFC